MALSPVSLLIDSSQFHVHADVMGDALWLSGADMSRVTGFELKPEGLCRDELCYPLPPGREQEFVRDGMVNLAAFWRRRGSIVMASQNGDTWAFGVPVDDQSARLDSLEAPDFTLPDKDGNLHSLSDYRGQKVLLTTWASWCGCRLDLPVWQRLHDEAKDAGFTVIAVAMDSKPGAADPWIEKASPTYPALIDKEHALADAYNLVNVPQAAWINEEGRIVRPPEAAGAFDFLNKRDPSSPGISPELIEKNKATRRFYLDALRDWIAKGDESTFALSEAEIRERMDVPGEAVREAHVAFRLGQHLVSKGRAEEGEMLLNRAKTLHPESWSIWRQTAEKLESGIAAGPDFNARVLERAKENKPYYAPIEMPGIPG